MRRNNKYKKIYLVIQAVILVLFLIFVEDSKKIVKDVNYDIKYMAASQMKICTDAVREEKINRGIGMDITNDINNTGIIGVDINGITTTLGSIESKRTSANPNFAAVMVDMLLETGAKSGDNIAINFSSSFPGLNIATIVACDVLDLKPIIITSIGSSTWGGNNLEFTYLDMEEFLYSKGFIRNKSIAVSAGGERDLGKDMNPQDLSLIIERMEQAGKRIIWEEDLASNINIRKDLYYKDVNDIHCFINVGGNIVSFGDTMDSLNTPPGLLKDMDYKFGIKSGLVQLFNAEGVPVIHLLNIKDLSHNYGLEVDQNRPFVVGEGDIYYSDSYNYKLIIFVVLITIVSLLVYKRTMLSYEQ